MTFRTLIFSAVAFGALAILGAFAPSAQAYQSLGGACSLEFRVNLAEDGSIMQRNPGTVRCAGMIGRRSVDPGVADATISGRFRRRGTRCEPALRSGSVRLQLRPLISFDARPEIVFNGDWKGAGLGPADAVDGKGIVEGLTMAFAGTARLVPANLSCTSHTLQMELAFMPR
jgi:hypothetical protein